MGNQLKYKIGTFSRNRACIGASTGHRPRYFFLQYLYRYETAVPGGFFQKKSVQITHRYAVQGYRGTCVQVPSPDDPEESWYRCCLECIQFYMSRHLRMLVLDRNNVRIQKNPGSVLIEVPNLYWNVVVVAPSEITVFNLLTSRRLHSVVPLGAGSGHWRARAHANGLQW